MSRRDVLVPCHAVHERRGRDGARTNERESVVHLATREVVTVSEDADETRHAFAPAKVLRPRATAKCAQRTRHHVERRQRVAIAGPCTESSQKRAGRTVTFVSAEAEALSKLRSAGRPFV